MLVKYTECGEKYILNSKFHLQLLWNGWNRIQGHNFHNAVIRKQNQPYVVKQY